MSFRELLAFLTLHSTGGRNIFQKSPHTCREGDFSLKMLQFTGLPCPRVSGIVRRNFQEQKNKYVLFRFVSVSVFVLVEEKGNWKMYRKR